MEKDDHFKLQDKIVDTTKVGDSNSTNVDKKTLNPSESMNTIGFTEHYVPMVRSFVMSHWSIWILNAVVTVGSFIAFCVIPGSELVLSLYIPLDLLLNISKSSFYFYYLWVDQRNKED